MHKRARGLEDDPLSAASAGLLALGVERSRRAEAMELLAAMLDLADDKGDVLLDGALFAVEQRMGVDSCLEIYAWLELLGVVVRIGDGWSIPAFDAHHGPEGETLASLAVLRRHLDSVGQPEAEVPDLVADGPTVVPMRKARRVVPMAVAGLAASIAVVTGVSQFVPQAAVTGQNVARNASAPTTIPKSRIGSVVPGALSPTVSSVGSTPAAADGTGSPGAVLTPTTAGLVDAVTGVVTCAIPSVVTTVSNVELVRVPLAGPKGETIWAAVVTGTATLTEGTQGLLLPALEVVAHVVDGDTAPVLATLSAPLLLPNVATPYSAVVALGVAKPTAPVTASAVASGFKAC